MSYITLAQLKEYLGISSATDDSILTSAIVDAVSKIEQETQKKYLVQTETTEVFDAIGNHIHGAYLEFDSNQYLADVPTTITNGNGNAVTSFVMMPRNKPPYYGIRIRESASEYWTYNANWESAISITGKWGYSLNPPNYIIRATLIYAAFLYRRKDNQLSDVTTVSGGIIIKPNGLPQEVDDLLRLDRPVLLS